MRTASALALIAVAGAGALAAPAAGADQGAGPAASGPRVEQMVVFRDGSAKVRTLRAAQTTVRVRGRRCAVASASPLAALLRSRVAPVRVRDFGSCSRRASDGGGLFVSAIGADRNRRQDGWVYKVGHRLATAGAADPEGPFGNGRLRRGARVTWFFCRLQNGTCQRTLSVAASAGGGTVEVRVRSHDEEGRAQPAPGATVRVGSQTVTTGPDGVARVQAPAGRHAVYAERAGDIRSAPVTVTAG
jgi:hypothetical protein